MSKLRGKMAEAGYTQKALASAIGISANSLNDKINQKDKLVAWDKIDYPRLSELHKPR